MSTIEEVNESQDHNAKVLFSNQASTQPKPQRNWNNQLEVPNCLWCERICAQIGRHNLNQCEAFMNTGTRKRADFVKRYKVCFSCLKNDHLIGSCNSYPDPCGYCNVPHSDLLECPMDILIPPEDETDMRCFYLKWEPPKRESPVWNN